MTLGRDGKEKSEFTSLFKKLNKLVKNENTNSINP